MSKFRLWLNSFPVVIILIFSSFRTQVIIKVVSFIKNPPVCLYLVSKAKPWKYSALVICMDTLVVSKVLY